MADCTHCKEPVQPTDHGDWIHARGLHRCQSPDVRYGHLAHPEGTPCRADGPNPCLGATESGGSVSPRCGGCRDLGPHNYGPGCEYASPGGAQ